MLLLRCLRLRYLGATAAAAVDRWRFFLRFFIVLASFVMEELTWTASGGRERMTSCDSSPLVLASAPQTFADSHTGSVVPSVANLAGTTLGGDHDSGVDGTGGMHLESDDMRDADVDDPDLCPSVGCNELPHADSGDGMACPRPSAAPLPPRKYEPSLPGPKHGRGGRKTVTGRNSKKNFGRGLRRVVGAFLCEADASTFSRLSGVPAAATDAAFTLLRGWSWTPGSEQVWLVPGTIGVVALRGEWKRDRAGQSASICVWLGLDWWSRCMCVGSSVHRDKVIMERPTTCKHAGALDAAVDDLSSSMGVSPDVLRQHLLRKEAEAASHESQGSSEELCFHVVGALYVAVCHTS